jgi:phospholipid transport system substrate-binding protein
LKEVNVKKRIIVTVFILILIPGALALAQPLDTLRASIDQAVKILNDPAYQDEAQKVAQRDEIWKVIRQVFDLEGIARITLGRNWRRFTPAEQIEFTEIFGRFLGTNYVEKIQSGFSGEKVEYLKADLITEKKAVVKTTIIRESTEIPVHYKMHQKQGTWRVYDVIIEGVSLVKNYRTQFNSLLMKNSPRDLIESMKKKL